MRYSQLGGKVLGLRVFVQTDFFARQPRGLLRQLVF
jgi:hypothetical protein